MWMFISFFFGFKQFRCFRKDVDDCPNTLLFSMFQFHSPNKSTSFAFVWVDLAKTKRVNVAVFIVLTRAYWLCIFCTSNPIQFKPYTTLCNYKYLFIYYCYNHITLKLHMFMTEGISRAFFNSRARKHIIMCCCLGFSFPKCDVLLC